MNLLVKACLLLAAFSLTALTTVADSVLRFRTPAAHFTEALPLGNGRIGVLLFGSPDAEELVLNETGMWSGSPQNADRPDAAAALPEIRRLLLTGKNREAEAMVDAHFTARGAGSGWGNGAHLPYGCYQVLGKLRLGLTGTGQTQDYRRELDLSTATASVDYGRQGVHYRRECFVSEPDQVAVMRLTADRPGSLSLTAELDRPENYQTAAVASDELLMTGQLDNGTDGHGVRYAARLRIRATGGRVTTTAGGQAVVEGADEVLLLFAAITDIRTFAGRHDDDPMAATAHDLAAVAGKDYAALRAEHVADYRRYFDRVSLRLGPTAAAPDLRPVSERLRAQAGGANDPDLARLYFDFGRYLLLSSSRPGGLPANLQGLWADGVQTPWNGDWHLDVNVQMNYWPAEVCNLSELHGPLFELIASLQEPGTRTAREYYQAGGWVAHVFANPWGYTSPGEQASWGASTLGSAWLCQHLWEHYLYTGDVAFLRRVAPLLQGSARFYSDMLIKEPGHGWLVTAPSNSPENSFRLPDGSETHLCLGSTYDEQLLRNLFQASAAAATVLGDHQQAEWSGLAARLAPTQIGADGRILEWLQPYPEVDPHHRHVSHLWGLFPGEEIDVVRTPALAEAARKTLEVRGDDGTGWGIAHKLALWARLGDGNRALQLLRNQLRPVAATETGMRSGGGTYPNLFDAHPPFQIDGNLGSTAGIAEMLVQSQAGELRLLPALPTDWPEGVVRGLCTRQGCIVDVEWSAGRLTAAVLRALRSSTIHVRAAGRVVDLPVRSGETYRLNAALELVPPA